MPTTSGTEYINQIWTDGPPFTIDAAEFAADTFPNMPRNLADEGLQRRQHERQRVRQEQVERARERDRLEWFIRTGRQPQRYDRLSMFRRGNTLYGSFGCWRFLPGSTLFKIDRDARTLTVKTDRTKHLRDILVALAEREGLQLIDSPEYIRIRGNVQSVPSWRWDNLAGIDDGDLLLELSARRRRCV